MPVAKRKSRRSINAAQRGKQQKNLLQNGKHESIKTANRKYKDTIFRMLFSNKKNLLSLYNAVNHRKYQNAEDLEIVTLENAVYMGMKNDLAFIVNMNLFLYEHQSTWNPNMPLRDLFYISSEYQKLVTHQSLYSTALQKIPAPKFVVFYNGAQEMADRRISCLSEAYENMTEEPDLELKVVTLNVNEGHNQELMEQCKTLKEYTQYVARVRQYRKELPLNEAVELAVNECIREDILTEFLSEHRAEVIEVSIFEYDKEWEEKKLREAEYEAGRQEGVLEGAMAIIELSKRLHLDNEDIIQQLCRGIKISRQKAESLISDYEKMTREISKK